MPSPFASPDRTFALMLATLRWPNDAARRAAIGDAAASPVDWNRFLALAARHRVSPLALQGIDIAGIAAPDRVLSLIRAVQAKALFAELAMAGELSRLEHLLAPDGIAVVALKGPAQSLRSFGRLGLRINRDIDILIPAGRIADMERILLGANYSHVEPSGLLTGPQRARWLRDHKDMVFRSPGHAATIEIHWRLFDNPVLMPLPEPVAPERLGMAPLRDSLVLPDGLNLRYLCHHGAQHGWSRLKWLADVNALVARQHADEIRRAYRFDGRDPDHAVGQALILCRELFGAALPADIEAELDTARRARWLARLAWSYVLRSDVDELEARRFGSTVKNLSHYALHDGWRYWLEELRFDLTVTPRGNLADGEEPRGRIHDWLHRHFSGRQR